MTYEIDVPLVWNFITCVCGVERHSTTACPDCGDARTERDENVLDRVRRFRPLNKVIAKHPAKGDATAIPVLMRRYLDTIDSAFRAMSEAVSDDTALERLHDALKRFRQLQNDTESTTHEPSYAQWWTEWDALLRQTATTFRTYLRLATADSPDTAADVAMKFDTAAAKRERQEERVRDSFSRLVVTSPRGAEELVAEWMKASGIASVTLTPPTSDGGIDIRGAGVVAQVKATAKPVARPDVQKLYGVATAESATGYFFSLSGYSPPAVEWADRVGVVLFTFDREGRVTGTNRLGRQSARANVGWEPLTRSRHPDQSAPIGLLLTMAGCMGVAALGAAIGSWVIGLIGLSGLLAVAVMLSDGQS